MNSIQGALKTKIGTLYLVVSARGLKGVFWEKQALPLMESFQGSGPEIKMLARAVQELEEYFKGARKKFDLPLDVQGTPFQKRVWEQVSQIPYGQTLSYRDVAERIDHSKAMRAVGAANGKNPLCIVVPCHRVIASDGSLGGYSGGLEIKEQLLQMERIG